MNSSLVVDWCSYKAAKFAVKHWHYSKRMPKFKQVFLGVWENKRFIGCVIFGLSVTPHLGDSYNLSSQECAELTRIALNEHESHVSRIASEAIKLLKVQSPGLRLLISYADPFYGHLGRIYQAMNWIYVGRSSRIKQYYWRHQWRNDTSMFRYFKHYPDEKEECKTRLLPRKFKYLYPLDKAMRRQIIKLAQPYPQAEEVSKVICSTSS